MKHDRILSALPALLALLIMAAACYPPSGPVPTVSPLVPTTAPGQAMEGVAAPTVAAALSVPDPQPGTATLHGQLLVSKQFPGIIGELFLAPAEPTSNPDVFIPALDEKNDPRAILNRQTFEFVFANVRPGKYALIVWEPFNSQLVEDPKTKMTLFVDLAADQKLELGQIPVGPQP